jgi:hypothetical protein
MTMQEAIAQQPMWVQWWLYWLIAASLVAPLGLLIWRQTRLAGIVTIIASLVGGFGVQMLFDRMGYVKLIGLPHIIFWTPLAIYLITLLRRDLPTYARWLVLLILVTILISLAFDYTDAIRYLLGDRAPHAAAPA